jgi:phosphoribosylformylglycinamidine (FGAM) synthase-like enzyme
VFTRHGEVVHDAPARSLADEGPVYDRPVADWTHPCADEDVDGRVSAAAECRRAVRRVVPTTKRGPCCP